MALDRDDVNARDNDNPADTRDPRTPAMGGKGQGQRQATQPAQDDDDDDDNLAPEIKAIVARKVKAATAKANREARDRRLEAKDLADRLAELEAAQQEAADAQLPEIEKAKKRVEKIEAELAERQADLEAIADAYAELQDKFDAYMLSDGKVRPERRDAVLRHIDFSSLDRDEETGKAIGLDKALDAVLKEFPEWSVNPPRAGTPPPSNGGGTPPRRGVGSHAGAGGDPVARAREQLIEKGSYQRF